MKSPTSRLSVFGCDVLKRCVPLIAACALVFFFLSLPHSAEAALHEYRMTFTPSSSPETVGYTFHVGNESTIYTAEFDLGNPPASGGTVIYALDLEDSNDLFMSLRAYDAQGLRSEFSNEILVSAVSPPLPSPPDPEPMPDPEPLPDPEPTPEPVASPSPEPAPDPGPTDPTGPRSAVLFFDDFEGYVMGQEPTEWLDTGAGNDLAEDPELFGVGAAPDGGLAFTTISTETNIHSHYAGEARGTDAETIASSLEWWNYDYVGRMRFDDPSAGIGVTVLSDYPNTDSYLRLRRYRGRSSFHLAPHSEFSADSCIGRTETEVETISNTWYHFRFRTVDETGATRVLARVWPEDDLEPSDWQIDCLWDAWPDAAGRPGVWSMGPGQKFWDDLGAIAIETSGASDPDPTLEDSLLYAEDFEGLALGSDPALWLDTARNNSFKVDPALFSVGEAPDGSRALVNRTRETNIHSHYLGDQASSWQDYEYSGRMLFSSDRSGMGVTAYSDYPNSNSYIRLRRYKRRPVFHIANHSDPASKCLGSTESGVTSKPGVWYEFRLRTFRDAGAIRVQGKVWADTDSEPIDWQIDCVTSDAGLLAQEGGVPGVWSMGSGEKFWDDIRVERMASPAP